MVQAVRDGAQPGDPLPAVLLEPKPFITGVYDAEVFITGHGNNRRVAVLFSHEGFPGVRFGHRFKPISHDGDDPHGWLAKYEDMRLKEEIETGALHGMMRDPPTADENGMVWTSWGDD